MQRFLFLLFRGGKKPLPSRVHWNDRIFDTKHDLSYEVGAKTNIAVFTLPKAYEQPLLVMNTNVVTVTSDNVITSHKSSVML